ncbi:MAG: hypothetical protein V1809_06005, partial [Planctomycetota bacterium]
AGSTAAENSCGKAGGNAQNVVKTFEPAGLKNQRFSTPKTANQRSRVKRREIIISKYGRGFALC